MADASCQADEGARSYDIEGKPSLKIHRRPRQFRSQHPLLLQDFSRKLLWQSKTTGTQGQVGMALLVGPRWGRTALLGLMGLFSVYVASLDWHDRGAFGAPLPLGALLATAAALIVWFATSGLPRLRWWGFGTIGLCLLATLCSVTAWWLWLTLWRPAGYPDYDPAANARVDVWLARADYSYFAAFVAAAALALASAIGARRPRGARRT